MGRMTLTINFPERVGSVLKDKAKQRGKGAAEYIEDLVTEDLNRPSLDELLAPIREGFKKSGASELELEQLFAGEIRSMRAEKRHKRVLEDA